jgi:three-Cys-motif partner protein
MTQENLEHRFGGAWTEIKLELLQGYLHFYTQALKNKPFKNKPFKLLYIDAFAGTGDRTVSGNQPGLFVSEPMKGSARIALELERPFDRYVFIEQNSRRFQALETLRRQYLRHQVEFLRGEANVALQNLCTQVPWPEYRAVLFLDPYGLSVEWTTLQSIARTQAIDLMVLVFAVWSVPANRA